MPSDIWFRTLGRLTRSTSLYYPHE